ncbi:polymorphic toxin type 47 domain-containing protein, partial [Paracidovorax citrulli]
TKRASDRAYAAEPALAGAVLDRKTGLHYNTFRYYDADLGAFTTPDPIGLAGGVNLHEYAPNPLSWIDPLGWCKGLSGGNWKFNPVKDVDMRGGASYRSALDEAFRRTGVPKEQFTVTKWGKTIDGKSIPVEYTGPGGANVNMDIPSLDNVKSNGGLGEGPHQPHIGYQTPGKGSSRTRGHIFVDNVPATR